MSTLGPLLPAATAGASVLGTARISGGESSYDTVDTLINSTKLPKSLATVTANSLTYNLIGCHNDRTDKAGCALIDFYASDAGITQQKCVHFANMSLARGIYAYIATEYGTGERLVPF
ncbi:hypothetical protein K437DRAFT_259673 [Tilletiaria anomala UBC 951]|uniref:Uncharacterized protein n=1 Tax=Tilletiaria anomala (strain ATCC 24038 / CBS 436.72 / UBC 951) TaxID=1037660 RepID=A0A066VGN2_TILAU|nr:uncharacterized protein K437DRAFT_259673 [Tilletiaria anomala UBC 951]KDN37745.1 hypothetical protein K437DRAFT_259673 [Tilletiaria anomala UBC 951]